MPLALITSLPESGFTLTISPLTMTALETDLEARAPGEQGLAAQGFLAMQGFFAAQGFTAQGFLAAQGFFAAHGLT
ncbi:MAG: hypothetical protein IH919_00575 [Deltaproteobacteria bacterium]|nr:hypothetical protein [Deltaproteobacteria bacterium]